MMQVRRGMRYQGKAETAYVVAGVTGCVLVGVMIWALNVRFGEHKPRKTLQVAQTPAGQAEPVTPSTPTPVTPSPAVSPQTPEVVVVSEQPTAGGFPDGKPHAIAADKPTRIGAADFDLGGPGVAYRFQYKGKTSKVRPNDQVGIGEGPGGSFLEFLSGGDWFKYTVSVEQPGSYGLRFNYARGSGGSGRVRIGVEGEGQPVEGVVADFDKGQSYKAVSFANLMLKAGVQTIKVDLVDGGLNFAWIELTPPGGAAAVAPDATAATTPPTPSAVEVVDVASPAGVDDRFDNLKRVPSETGWTSGTKGGALSIMEALGLKGKAIRFQDDLRTADVWVRHEFPAVTTAYSAEFQLRFGQLADGFGLDLMSGEKVLTTVETSRGQLAVRKNAKDWQALCPYKPGVWYTIRLDVGPDGKMAVFVDNEQKAEGVALLVEKSPINAWRVGTGTPSTGGMYLHYAKVTPK